MEESTGLLDQQLLVAPYLIGEESRLSSFSFTNIFAWKDFFKFDFKMIRGVLCVFAENRIGRFLYLPPLGKGITREVVDECFGFMEKANCGSGVTRVENVSAKHFSLFPGERFRWIEKGFEYLYWREDIAVLRGNPYKSKRSSYNQFVRGYEHAYTAYNHAMLDECLTLYERWAREREKKSSDDIYRYMLYENRKVHELILRHYRALGLIGRVVEVEGAVKAYTFGFPVSKDTFCILFEIADLEVSGLAVYIFREFCRDRELRPYSFINVMDDFGLKNIRETKMSFHPMVLLQSYVVRRK